MHINTLAFKRRNILGELYPQSDIAGTIPVYLDDNSGEPIGTVEDDSHQYPDAFLFHLPEDVLKKLSTNSYDIGVDYNFADTTKRSYKDRIKLNYMVLQDKQSAVPIPRRHGAIPAKGR